MKKMFLECKQAWLSAMAFVVMFVVSMEVLADVPLRRPISPERPTHWSPYVINPAGQNTIPKHIQLRN